MLVQRCDSFGIKREAFKCLLWRHFEPHNSFRRSISDSEYSQVAIPVLLIFPFKVLRG